MYRFFADCALATVGLFGYRGLIGKDREVSDVLIGAMVAMCIAARAAGRPRFRTTPFFVVDAALTLALALSLVAHGYCEGPWVGKSAPACPNALIRVLKALLTKERLETLLMLLLAASLVALRRLVWPRGPRGDPEGNPRGDPAEADDPGDPTEEAGTRRRPLERGCVPRDVLHRQTARHPGTATTCFTNNTIGSVTIFNDTGRRPGEASERRRAQIDRLWNRGRMDLEDADSD
jgi:hypothetical protein